MNPTWNIEIAASSTGNKHWPARVSIPLPKGQSIKGFTVIGPDQRKFRAQWRTLTRWPDESSRWVQLDFQATSAGHHVVTAEVCDEAVEQPIVVERAGETFRLQVGKLQVTLDHGALTFIRYDGREMLRSDQPWQFVVHDAAGKTYTLKPDNSSTLVEALGEHRFQASWTARHIDATGAPLLEARMRLEMLAGIEGFRFDYQFFHKLPGCDHLDLESIDASFPLPGMLDDAGRCVVLQSTHGNLSLHRYARLNHPVPLLLDRTTLPPYVENPEAVLEDYDHYPHFLTGYNKHMGSAVALENDRSAVVIAMRDFMYQRPKTMTVRPGGVDFGIWPRRAGMLRLPQGRSCRQQFSFRFMPSEAEKVDHYLSVPTRCDVEPTLAWLDRESSKDAGPTWDQPRVMTKDDPGASFFSNILEHATFRWQSVAEMFHFGDVPDMGYTMSYPACSVIPGTETPPGGFTFSTYHVVHALFHSPDRNPKVWTNNEYDIIYCLALETMRTKKQNTFEKLRSAARHQVEVDFVHHSDHWQQHRGTPAHSYDHTSGTAIIASHQWTQGLYYYYVLTGDDDVPDVVRGICDFNMMFIDRDELAFSLYFNRELGWALIALVFGYELTGDQRYIEFSKKIIKVLESHAERTDFTELEKKAKGTTALNATGLGTGFNVNTIPLGLKFYHQATEEPWAKDLLIKWVDFGMTNHNNRALGVRVTELFPETFCYVCELTGDDRYLRESTWHLRMFFRGFNSAGWIDTWDRPLDTKTYVRVYRSFVHQISAMSRAGLLEAFEAELMGD